MERSKKGNSVPAFKANPSDSSLPEAATSERSAGVPPAVSGASRPRSGKVTIRDRGRLPHWEQDAASYFITFRLADSLPKSILDEIEFEKKNILRTAEQLGRPLSPSERKRLGALSGKRIEEYLDHGAGACHLANAAFAEIVAQALRYFDDQRYRSFSWCIMPNHVHVVAKLFPGIKLASIVHSWKSFTSKEAQRLLNLHGSVWQREYYDSLIRNEAEFERANRYVVENPVKAGLDTWLWVWQRGQDALATAGETPALHVDR